MSTNKQDQQREGHLDCPRCGAKCWRDEVDVGVGIMYGPWGCPCGWSESSEYDVTAGPKWQGRHRVDQWGGLTPISPSIDNVLAWLDASVNEGTSL